MRRMMLLPLIFGVTMALLFLVAPSGVHAQEWSEWTAVSDDKDNLLQIRWSRVADDRAEFGFYNAFEIVSQYDYALLFEITFTHDDGLHDTWKFHISPGTTCGATLDADTIADTHATHLVLHTHEPDPN